MPNPLPADDVDMPRAGKPDAVRCRWCNTTKWRFHGVALCPFCDHPKPKERQLNDG
jgi:rubrerythrin